MSVTPKIPCGPVTVGSADGSNVPADDRYGTASRGKSQSPATGTGLSTLVAQFGTTGRSATTWGDDIRALAALPAEEAANGFAARYEPRFSQALASSQVSDPELKKALQDAFRWRGYGPNFRVNGINHDGLHFSKALGKSIDATRSVVTVYDYAMRLEATARLLEQADDTIAAYLVREEDDQNQPDAIRVTVAAVAAELGDSMLRLVGGGAKQPYQCALIKCFEDLLQNADPEKAIRTFESALKESEARELTDEEKELLENEAEVAAGLEHKLPSRGSVNDAFFVSLLTLTKTCLEGAYRHGIERSGEEILFTAWMLCEPRSKPI